MSNLISTCDQLALEDYNALDFQFSCLPDTSCGYSASGEHYVLVSLLNRLGFYPASREDAIELTERLLANGYK